jgi:hypothetical protein
MHINLGLPDGIFSGKNPNLGKFLRVLEWKMLVYFGPSGIFYGNLKYFTGIGYILWSFLIHMYVSYFGLLSQEKSGNPVNPSCRGRRLKLFISCFVTTTDVYGRSNLAVSLQPQMSMVAAI